MANIADNLKRLLGTEGHNIQEVLENADSIGGGGSSDIPMIEFTQDYDNYWHVSQTVGIEDVESYTGMCIIKVPSADAINDTGAFIGNAMEGTYCFVAVVNASKLAICIFIVHDGVVDSFDHELQLS